MKTSLSEIRKLLKESQWKKYSYKLRGMYWSKVKKPKSKKELQIIKQNTKAVDMVILSKLSENSIISIHELEKYIPPLTLALRLEVMNHYNLVNYNENEQTVSIGEEFGNVDILTLPIHADQIPLTPREKLVYRLVKLAEDIGGCRTIKDIHELDQAWGHKCSYFAIQMSAKYLEKIGVIEKSSKKFGYPAWCCAENVFVYESTEELINICESIDAPWRRLRKE